MEGSLGLRKPVDDDHIRKYLFTAHTPETVANVEKILPVRYDYRIRYDQGEEGACAGFSGSWAQSFDNGLFYDAFWLYFQAQIIDDWPETPPEQGTSLRAVFDVLRAQGHRRIYRGKSLEPQLVHGVLENRWATSVDEMRTALSKGLAVSIGVNWYQNFDRFIKKGYNNYWIGEGELGRIRGGHAVCVYGASDRRQAFKIVNNWGLGYPLVWLPYKTMQRLLNEDGEAAIVTQRS